MIRPFRAETERYGHYSVAGEFVYDRPFQWGSKRTGPDLARVGGRYSDEWHRSHLNNPRDVVPESNMPGYPWLAKTKLNPADAAPKMRALKRLGRAQAHRRRPIARGVVPADVRRACPAHEEHPDEREGHHEQQHRADLSHGQKT